MQRFGVFFQHTHWTKKQGLPLVPNTTIRIRIRNKLMGIDFPCSTSHAYFRLFILALLLFRTALSESNDCNGEQCIAGNTHVRAKRRKKEEGQYCVQDICLTFDPSDVNIDMRKLLEERGTQVTDALLNDFVRIAPAPRTLCLLVIRDKYEASDWNRWPHSSAKYLTTQILRRAMEMRLMYFVFADVGSLFTEDAVGDDESVASVTAELIQGLRPHAPSADGLLFLLDASVIPSSLATTIRKTFPELPLLNAHTDIRKTNSNFPQLAYDPARDAPPAFVKTTLSGRDKWSEFADEDRGVQTRERYWVERSRSSIERLLSDARFSVQKLLIDFRAEQNGSIKFQQRCAWAFGDLTCYEIASKSFIIKEGATRPRPTYSWFQRDHDSLSFDHGTLLYHDGPIPRRLPFSYLFDENYWSSIRRAIEAFVDTHDGPHIGVFELVRTSRDVATLFDVNPCPWELGWPPLLLDVQVRSAHRMLHDGLAKHKLVRIMRHGESENNKGWDMLGRDPKIRDAPLTKEGKLQAATAGTKLCHVDRSMCGTSESHRLLIVTSPLSRAMETARLALKSSACTHYRSVVHPDLREWRRALADVGNAPLIDDDLFDTSLVPDDWGAENTFSRESVQHLIARVTSFRRWLAAQNEPCVLVVSHHDFLAELTSADISLYRGDVYPPNAWSSTVGSLLVPPKNVHHCNETESATRCSEA